MPARGHIHGGAFYFGHPNSLKYDHWIHQQPHVIIVSVAYRLTAFGFLAHPEFATDPSLGDNNIGLQDQQEALRWVKDHIEAFGGHHNHVTIDGESAGGSAIEFHLVALSS